MRIFRTSNILATVCAAAVVTYTAPAAAQSMADSILDGACVGLKNKFNGQNVGGGVEGEVLGRGLQLGREAFKSRSVICKIEDPRVMLVTTTDFINRTTLHAAKGLSSVEVALGMKNETAAYIAALEAALQAGDPQGQIDDQSLKVTENLGKRAADIQEELKKREDEDYLTPEQRTHVLDAQRELSTAGYFLTQSATGASSFGLMFSKMSPQAQLSFSLPKTVAENEVSNSFLVSAPARIVDMGNNLRSVVSLGGKVEDSLSPKDIDEMRKKIKGERKKGKKQAKNDAKAVAQKYEDQMDSGPFIGAAITVD